MIEKLKKITVLPLEYLNNEVLRIEPLILNIKINQPTFIVGDLHQDENAFFAILEATKFFEKDINLIFLGDYIDRGKNIWLLNKLLYLRNEFKDRVILLRGNHETSKGSKVLPPITHENSFFYQLELFKEKYPQYINDEIIEFYKNFFETLPIGIIAEYDNFRFFLTHANVPRIDLKKAFPKNLEKLLKSTNPIGISYINDFLWNDLGDNHYTSKVRYEVSKEEINYFLKKYGFDYIIRAHQFVKDGYRIDDRVFSVFSTGIGFIKDKNLASAYNGIPAIFEITRGKFYQVDINSKSLEKGKKVYYKKFIPKNIKFPKPKKSLRTGITNGLASSTSSRYTQRQR